MKGIDYLETILLAVNGTLMRGLELNKNLTSIGAEFLREDQTDNTYKLWTIDDIHPAMVRVKTGGNNIHLEIWKVPIKSLATLLLNEPAGLSIGKVILKDKSIILGVIGEPILCQEKLEITKFGGWRQYINQKNNFPIK